MWDSEQVLTHINCLIGVGSFVLDTEVFLWIT